MKKYHVIKRDSGLNVTSNKRRKKGLDWFTQTKIGSRPLGSKCEIGDIAYIYIIDYGVVAKGEIIAGVLAEHKMDTKMGGARRIRYPSACS